MLTRDAVTWGPHFSYSLAGDPEEAEAYGLALALAGHSQPKNWCRLRNLWVRRSGRLSFLDKVVTATNAVPLGSPENSSTFSFGRPSTTAQLLNFILALDLMRIGIRTLRERFYWRPPWVHELDLFQALQAELDLAVTFLTFWDPPVIPAGIGLGTTTTDGSPIPPGYQLGFGNWLGYAHRPNLTLRGSWLSELLTFAAVYDTPAMSTVMLDKAVDDMLTLIQTLAHEFAHNVFTAGGLGSGIDNQWDGPDFRTYVPVLSGLADLRPVPRIPNDPFSGSSGFSRHWVCEWVGAATAGAVAGATWPARDAFAQSVDDAIAWRLDTLHVDAAGTPGYG